MNTLAKDVVLLARMELVVIHTMINFQSKVSQMIIGLREIQEQELIQMTFNLGIVLDPLIFIGGLMLN